MTQDDLFDGKRGELLKTRGMALAEASAFDQLEAARDIAKIICRHRGEVTADDVGRVLKRDHGIDSLGPAAGSLFKTKDFAWTGRWKKSVRTKNHSRMLRVWRLA